jgi:bifunctional DNase/RNase
MKRANVCDVYTVEFEGQEEPGTVVVLNAHDQSGYLPIYITAPQGESIVLQLRGLKPERPKTYELMAALVAKLGGTVEAVHIATLRDKIFQALLHVSVTGATHEIDCRPSDALALAAQVKAPVFVAPDLFHHAATPEAAILGGTVRSIKPLELGEKR